MNVEDIKKEPLHLEEQGLALAWFPHSGIYSLIDENHHDEGEVSFGIAAAREIHRWLGEHLKQLEEAND